MFKLIFFLVGLAVAIVFSALNIGNAADISFGFKILKDAPVFLVILTSFLAGSVFTLPFAFFVSLNKKKVKKQKAKDVFIDDNMPSEFTPDQTDVPQTE